MQLSSKIEAVLFKLNEPTSLNKLCSILNEDEVRIVEALNELNVALIGRGVNLLQNNNEYSLVSSKDAAGIIEKMVKEEMSKEIGKAGLETLSIVLYKGPITRREIDFIRGVNSTFILRSLMVRGLVERIDPSSASGQAGRSPQYTTTSGLLAHLGLNQIGELPEYKKVREEIVRTTEQPLDEY